MQKRDVSRAAGLAGLACLTVATITTSAAAATVRMQSAVDQAQSVGFDVILPLRDPAGLAALLKAQHDQTSSQFHQWITPQQFGERFGPDAATVASVAASLRALGLAVEVHSRSLRVTGSAAAVNKALSTNLMHGTLPDGRPHMVASSAPTLPADVSAAGGFVIDFARDVHLAHTYVRQVPGTRVAFDAPMNRTSTTGGYWYNDLKQAYQYPSYQTKVTVRGKTQRLDGTGVTIGILMSSDIFDSDVKKLFDHENFSKNAGTADPTLYKRVYVNGGATTAQGIANGSIDEASLDVEESITGAPGAHVVLYDIPDLADDDIIAGYTAIDEANEADVVSSSFGGCELEYTAAFNGGVDITAIVRTEHELFEQGNAQGISFLASSGDEAGLSCPTVSYYPDGTNGNFIPSVSVPAADTNVTAVGGTNMVTKHTAGSLDSSYVSENAWSDPEIPYDIYGLGATVSGGYWGAGGGLSTLFTRPLYQIASNTGTLTRRAMPDIGMQVGGCPAGISSLPCNGGDQAINGNGNTDRSYVITAVNGAFEGLIGTSIASPELAGATALLVEQYGRMGNLNNYIYAVSAVQALAGGKPSQPTTVFHRAIPGYNGVVPNGTLGNLYNYTSGVGTPMVYRYVGAPYATPAGVPQTASNP
nr:protease pro-enzyme activation domain-containing protein [uncultured Lichenicoccus sp.]